MAREPAPTRWWDNERALNRVMIGALSLLLFVGLGFKHGWANAARLCLLLAYCLSVMSLVARTCLAASLQDIRADKSAQVLGVFALSLGLTGYVLAGQRVVLYMSWFGVACGAVLGGILRFSISDVGRSIGRSERRVIGRVRKKLRRRQ